MPHREHRRVGARGQVTIPQALRDEFGIRGGDEVVIREEDGKLVIERSVSREDMIEGYRKRAGRSRKLVDEMEKVSAEADDHLGDSPDW